MKRCDAPAAPDSQTFDPDRLFASFAGRKGVVFAVSGGVDSTALMVLASRWSAPVPKLIVTVDHGLRSEAGAEARLVAAQAERLGLTCRIVEIRGLEAGGNVQERARNARYGTLVNAALAVGCDTIVTAHHREDQAETFLIRLKRGSGVYGLSAMTGETAIGGVSLSRPLLDVPRQALADLVAQSGLAVSDDPSNRDESFDRVKMRRLMPELEAVGLGAGRLAGMARSMRRAADALDHYATDLIRSRFSVGRGGVIDGPADAFHGVPDEVALRAFARLVTAAAGQDRVPRFDRLEAAFAEISVDGAQCRRTLHGAVIEAKDGVLRLGREWGRAGLPEFGIAGGGTAIWDGRFVITAPYLPDTMRIAPLGSAPVRLVAGHLPRMFLRAMPGLFSAERLIAVPAGVRAQDRSDGEGDLGELAVSCLVGTRLGFTEAGA